LSVFEHTQNNSFPTNSNHYKNPVYVQKHSRSSSRNLTATNADSNGTNKNMQGIKVTTALVDNTPKEYRVPKNDGWVDHDPSDFVNRVLKPENSMFESQTRLTTKLRAKTALPSDKILFEKLEKIEKARLTKNISQKHPQDPDSLIVRYQLEDVDENLDEDRLDLGSLAFRAIEASSVLEINPTYQVSALEENKEANEVEYNFDVDAPMGTEIKNLPRLRKKLTDIKLFNDKGGYSALGKMEYKRWKHRAYDVHKKLIYKIIKGECPHSKSRLLRIHDEKGKEVGTILVTHINPRVATCEIDFPKDSNPTKKLLLISILLAIMDQLEPCQDETSFVRKIVNKAFFGFSCSS